MIPYKLIYIISIIFLLKGEVKLTRKKSRRLVIGKENKTLHQIIQKNNEIIKISIIKISESIKIEAKNSQLINLIESAIESLVDKNNKVQIAEILSEIGFKLAKIGINLESIRFFEKSIMEYESIKITDYAIKKQLLLVYKNIGNLLYETKDYTRSAMYFEKEIYLREIHTQLTTPWYSKDYLEYVEAIFNAGESYRKDNQNTNAKNKLREAIKNIIFAQKIIPSQELTNLLYISKLSLARSMEYTNEFDRENMTRIIQQKLKAIPGSPKSLNYQLKQVLMLACFDMGMPNKNKTEAIENINLGLILANDIYQNNIAAINEITGEMEIYLGIIFFQQAQHEKTIHHINKGVGLLINANHKNNEIIIQGMYFCSLALIESGLINESIKKTNDCIDYCRKIKHQKARYNSELLISIASHFLMIYIDIFNNFTHIHRNTLHDLFNRIKNVLEKSLEILINLPPLTSEERLMYIKSSSEFIIYFYEKKNIGLKINLTPNLNEWLKHVSDYLVMDSPNQKITYEEEIRPISEKILQLIIKNEDAEMIIDWHSHTHSQQIKNILYCQNEGNAEINKMKSEISMINISILDQQNNHEMEMHHHSNARTKELKKNRDQLIRKLSDLIINNYYNKNSQQAKFGLDDYLQIINKWEKINSQRNLELWLLIKINPPSPNILLIILSTDRKKMARKYLISIPKESGLAELDDLEKSIRYLNVGRATRGLNSKIVPAIQKEVPHSIALERWRSFSKIFIDSINKSIQNNITDIHIITSGVLHSYPLAAELDKASPNLKVRQFPSLPSWARATEEEIKPSLNIAPKWACLASDGANISAPLPWVGVEARALDVIWQQVQHLPQAHPQWPQPGQSADAVQALAGMGHGNAPENNWALAGLLLQNDSETGQPRYFNALDLHHIREVRYLMMSCCILGRVRDAQGEPIGMTALAMGMRAQFAVGAVVSIDDFGAALVAMALHFAWAQGWQQGRVPGEDMDWSEVFHTTRRQLIAGQWPDGFGDWLQTHLERIATQSGDAFDSERWFALAELEPSIPSTLPDQIRHLAAIPTQVIRDTAMVMVCLG